MSGGGETGVLGGKVPDDWESIELGHANAANSSIDRSSPA
jgi:hypothetical protein